MFSVLAYSTHTFLYLRFPPQQSLACILHPCITSCFVLTLSVLAFYNVALKLLFFARAPAHNSVFSVYPICHYFVILLSVVLTAAMVLMCICLFW